MGRERLSAPSKRSPFLLDRSQLRDRRRRMPSLTDTAIRHALKRVEAGKKQENLAHGEGRGTGRLVLVLQPMPKPIGRAHVCTPVTNAQLVCRLLLEKTKNETN